MRLFITSLCIALVAFGHAQNTIDIKVNNTKPRIDDRGKIIDAHDGRVIPFGDKFYWYGTSYGNTNGFTTANHYVCYSSDDLIQWKKEGKLLEDPPEGVYYRPHVIYNQKTGKYVLWYNWYPTLWQGQFGVAASDHPQGPFVIHNDNVEVANSVKGLGDLGLFVDDDQEAYISYNTIQNHQVSVEKLDETYTSSTLENGGIIADHMEAGAMFKRRGKYYLLTDYTCCFCNYGSGARVYISDNPLNGFQWTGNINRYPGSISHVLNDGLKRGLGYETLSKVEGDFQSVEIYLNKENTLSQLQITLFTGNRPENCGDVSIPRVHPDFVTPELEVSVWHDHRWQSISTEMDEIIKTALNEEVILSLDNETTDRLRIKPKNTHPVDKVYLSEISIPSEDNFSIYITGPGIPQKPIIPAQQTYVMELRTPKGSEFVWIGDLWGSASDNVKGHDYQYWSRPLQFREDGTIKPMEWSDNWELETLR